MGDYYLLKELAPRQDSSPYAIATFDAVNKSFKVLFFASTEDEARGLHHRLLFGETDDA